MSKIAYLFPGQGSQAVGMGADLCTHYKAARDAYDEADEALGIKISTISFYGPEDALRETANTQPALFTASIAALRALKEAGAPEPEAVAGHSIGEYAACVAAGAFDFELGLHLVQRRAQEMQRAAALSAGAMAAVLGLSAADVEAICREVEQGGAGSVDLANLNGAGQVVISGEPNAVEKASDLAKERGAKRVMPLNVSGAFHSRLMSPAAHAMQKPLADAVIRDANIPIVSNLTGEYETSADDIRVNLASQIDHPVRWEESMQRLVADGFDTFVEVGTGKVLAGLMKRIAPDAALFGVGDSLGLQNFLDHGRSA